MLKGNTTEEQIWNYLSDNIKNDFGVAGLMGNLYAESGLSPINLQNSFEKKFNMTDVSYTKAVDNGTYDNFITDKAGYGLAQWTYHSRKQSLLEYAMKRNKSIGDLETQLEFLLLELTNSFKSVWSTLLQAKSVEIASNAVLLKFEAPANTSAIVAEKRISYGKNFYNKYHTVKASENKKTTPKIETTSELIITPYFGTTNTTYSPNRAIEWIVVHYTAGTTSKKGSALNLACGVKSGTLGTSAEFYVDDSTIIQYIQDIENRYSWSVGGSKYPTMSTKLGGIYYNKCTNKNSINIEICSNKTNKSSFNLTDSDWFFSREELILTAELIKKLMKKYNIDTDHVIMHHQVNGKNCPAMWTRNDEELKGWYDFLKLVNNGKEVKTPIITSSTTTIKTNATPPYLIKVTAAALNIRAGAGVGYAIKGVIKDKNTYTIIEEKEGWGKLKSGIGWINLKYTTKV